MPDYGSLEGGWGHIEMGPQQFIDYLLTPRNQQRTTQFAGGSHYGPDREATIPAENYAQAKAMLDLMAQKEQQERASMLTQQADDLMRRRVESGRTNLSPGSMTMGGETMEVPGKLGFNKPMSAEEQLLLAAAGYEMPYGKGAAGGPAPVDPTKKYGEETQRAAELREGITYLDGQIASLDPKDPRLPQLQQQRDQLAGLYLQTVGAPGGAGGPPPPGNPTDPAPATPRAVDMEPGISRYLKTWIETMSQYGNQNRNNPPPQGIPFGDFPPGI